MHDLFQHKGVRYRVAYGGRNGTKSYSFGNKAIDRCCQEKTDIVVFREYQTTIKKSVHKLICERISALNVGEAFHITDNKITNYNTKSTIIYQHLNNNYEEIKGMERVDIGWFFEAEDLQKESHDIVDPTIRRTPAMTRDPELWYEFNPRYEDDFVYQNFIVKPKSNAVVVNINYLDNPWCPPDQIKLANQCRAENEDEYRHIWLGEPRNSGGLVYPMFDPKVHIRDVDINRIEPVANFFMGQDPHTVYYPFCVWLGREPRGDGTFNYFIYNEYPTINSKDFNGKLYHELRKEKKCALTLNQRATIYKILDNTTTDTYPSIQIKARGIDTRFAKGAGTSSTTSNTRGIIVEMADPAHGGLVFQTPPEHMIDSQREVIKELLSYDKCQPMSAFNEPRLYVSSHCKNMIDSLKFHRFDRDGKEREDEKRKDPSDALKICMATAQMYKHAIKTEPKQYKPVPDTVDNLRSQYLGAGSTVTMR